MNDYLCEDANDNSLALRNDLQFTKMLKNQLILRCFEASKSGPMAQISSHGLSH